MADVKYTITADAKGAVTQIKKVEGAVEGMSTQAKQAKSPLAGMFGKLAIGAGVALAAKAAIRGMVTWMKDAVTKAAEQEAAEKLLNDALAATGRTISDNLPHFKEYAKQLQDQTIYGDEAILGAEALMIQLTDLDKKGIEAATKGAIGLATVFKTDLKSASALVAKAMAGNVGALSRYGLTVDRNLTLEEKRVELLKQLDGLYQTAKGATDTYQGAVSQLSNTYGDLKEEIGKAITENETVIETMKSVRKEIDELIESGKIEQWIADITLYMNAAAEVVKFWIDFEKSKFLPALKLFTGGVKDSDEAMGDFTLTAKGMYGPGEKLRALMESLGWKYDDIRKKSKSAKDTGVKPFNEELKKTKTIIVEQVVPAMNDLAGVAYNTQGDLKSAVFGANDEIVEDYEETVEEINIYWDNLTTDLGNAYGTLFLELTNKNTTFEESFEIFGGRLVDSFRATIADMISDWVTGFIQELVSSAAGAGESIAGSIGGALGGSGVGDIAGGVQNVTSALGGLASPIGIVSQAVTAIASVAQLFKKSGPSSTDSWHFEHIWINAKEIRDYMYLVQRNWLTKEIPERLSLIHI